MSFLGDRLTEKASIWGVHMGAPLFLNHRFMCLIGFCSRTLKLCEINGQEVGIGAGDGVRCNLIKRRLKR